MTAQRKPVPRAARAARADGADRAISADGGRRPRSAWEEAPDPFAARLRQAIKKRGLSLDRLRFHLALRGHRVSIATLSYWQSGRSRPDRAASLAALGSLEDVLELPADSLAELLSSRPRRSPSQMRSVSARFADVLTNGGEIDRLVAELDLDWESGFERISVHDLVSVDDKQRRSGQVTRMVLRALRDGVDRWPAFFYADTPQDEARFQGLANCHVGRIARDEGNAVSVTEMVLERPLSEGEAVRVEYATLGVSPHRMTSHHRTCLTRTREAHLEVTFHPDMVPVWAAEQSIVDGIHREEPVLLATNAVRVLRLDFGPGVIGAVWRWPS